MSWAEVFIVLIVSHLTGDFILQTKWQALGKRGWLTGDRDSRRALASHAATYLGAFIPAFVWLWPTLGMGVLLLAALLAIPHAIQDDGTLLAHYMRRVKQIEPEPGPLLIAVDQSFHVVALLLTAIIVS